MNHFDIFTVASDWSISVDSTVCSLFGTITDVSGSFCTASIKAFELFLRHGQFSLLFCHCFNYYFLPSYIISLFLAPFYIFLPSALLNDRKVWSFNWTCLHVIPLNACRKSHEVIQSAYMNLLYCNQLHSALTSETVVTPWSPIHLLPMMPNYYVFFRYPSADDITPAPELRLWCFNLNG